MDITKLDQPTKLTLSKITSMYCKSDYINQTREFLNSKKDFKVI